MDTAAAPVRRQDAAARAERAAELRVAGSPWADIAAETGYSDASNAQRAVRQYFGQAPTVDRDASRELWRQRAEWLWQAAVEDVQARRPGALRAAVALAQRASQLDGLDAPSAVTFYSPTSEEYSAVVAKMVELSRQASGAQQLGPEADPFADSEDFIDVEVVEAEQQ